MREVELMSKLGYDNLLVFEKMLALLLESGRVLMLTDASTRLIVTY